MLTKKVALRLPRQYQENCKARLNVAGTLRVPWRPRENTVISPRLLRHTECAYYFAVLLPAISRSLAEVGIARHNSRACLTLIEMLESPYVHFD